MGKRVEDRVRHCKAMPSPELDILITKQKKFIEGIKFSFIHLVGV